MDELTRHHVIPKSRWGKNREDNIQETKQIRHRAHHIIYGNALPHEQLLLNLWRNAQVIVWDEVMRIMEILNHIQPEEFYKKEAIDFMKYRKSKFTY